MPIISVVMPIHNDAMFLRYSLPALLGASMVDEIVVVLDRCCDGSLEFVAKHGDYRFHIYEKRIGFWSNRCAEAKWFGVCHSHGDVVLHCDADVCFDFSVLGKALHMMDVVDVVVFGYSQHSLQGGLVSRVKDHWVNFLNRFITRFRLQPRTGGVYLIRKGCAALSDVPSEYALAQASLKKAYLPSKTVHLRPRYDRNSQYGRGASRARLPQYCLWKVLVMAVLLFEPHLFVGYIHGRLPC